MLRVGLTGGLGSGKSTAAAMFAAHGAHVFYADEIARGMMQPGEQVYAAIVERFGTGVVRADGTLDRAALAKIAFGTGRIEELNAVVHPATIARQAELIDAIAALDPNAVTVVESALIFETRHGGEGGWHKRFDRIIFVRSSQEQQIARFVARSLAGKTASPDEHNALEAEARRRLAQQQDETRNAKHCDFVLNNDGTIAQLQTQVDAVWSELSKARHSLQ